MQTENPAEPMRNIAPEALTALVISALRGFGLTEADACKTAQILILADLFGIRTHGVARVEEYGKRLVLGGITARPNIGVETLTPSLARINGDNGVGPLVGMHALETAMTMAKTTGVGVAFAHSSNHFGPVSPYNFIAAQAGFASIIGSNSTTTIAPWGGKDARLGNSPVGFGVPNPGGDPVILDIAISVAARAKIRAAANSGTPIPPTWATDKEGHPTTDAKAALDGFLLPIGGHKGYGLALIVDLFAGLLSGASYLTHVKSWQDNPDQPQNLGHFFILIDTAVLGSSAWLAARMSDFAQILHTTPAADPAAPVLVPGEPEMRAYARQMKDGIRLDAAMLDRLDTLAARTPAE